MSNWIRLKNLGCPNCHIKLELYRFGERSYVLSCDSCGFYTEVSFPEDELIDFKELSVRIQEDYERGLL